MEILKASNTVLSPPVPAETCGDSRHGDHGELNLTKKDENLALLQVSLKYIWEALMAKNKLAYFFHKRLPVLSQFEIIGTPAMRVLSDR
jgi:hypothetical protein